MRTRPRGIGKPVSMFEYMFNQVAKLAGTDSDRDGVPDYRDCRPFDPTKHSIKPSRAMKKRLEWLPIFVAHQRIYKDDRPQEAEQPYHIMQKEAKEKYPETTRAALSAIKKNPSLVGQMEKLRGSGTTLYFIGTPDPKNQQFGVTEVRGFRESPTREVFINRSPEYSNLTRSDFVAHAVEYITNKFPPEDWEYNYRIMKSNLDRIIFTDDSKEEAARKIRTAYISTGLHELKHAEQSLDIDAYEKQSWADSLLPWSKRKQEQEAIGFSEGKMLERSEKNTLSPDMYKKFLRLD